MYTERSSVVGHATAWTAIGGTEREDHRVLPDGCMDLLWTEGQLLVAGPDTSAYVTTWRSGSAISGLRLACGVGPRVVGVPAHELRDQLVPLSALWPSTRVRRLAAGLHGAADPAAVLETIAQRQLGDAASPDPVAEHAVWLLDRGHRVDDVARAAGLSARQLHRRSLDAFGYGPKMLARILRLHRALKLGRAGLAPADVAVAGDYADQAHLARETRSLAGVTFAALVGRAHGLGASAVPSNPRLGRSG